MTDLVIYWSSAAVNVFWCSLDYCMECLLYLDKYLPGWKIYLILPFLITFFILPMMVVIFLYLSALALYSYNRKHFVPVIDAFQRCKTWKEYGYKMTSFWSAHGWIWHGYEVIGMDNIPDSGPALVVFYHGAFPVDMYYLLARIYLEKRIVTRSVVDNFVFRTPGLSQFFRFFGSFPGPRSKVVEFLKSGEVVIVAPGGAREALFSENYSIVWENRVGFAKAALEAEVPILPVFTENCRQAFDFLKTGKSLFRIIYEKMRIPFWPLYGGFPVKLRTYIGKPIPYDPSLTPQALSQKVKEVMEEMIATYQTQPPSILRGLKQRFCTQSNLKTRHSSTNNGVEPNKEISEARSSEEKTKGRPHLRKQQRLGSVTMT